MQAKVICYSRLPYSVIEKRNQKKEKKEQTYEKESEFKKKKKSKTEMNTEKWNCIKKLKQVATINKRLRRAQARLATDAACFIVINTTRTDLNKIARYFSRRNKVTVSSQKKVKALIFLRDDYRWSGRVVIIASAKKYDGIRKKANQCCIKLLD